MMKKLGAAFAVLTLLLLAGCNNARIPDGGKVMRDSDGNEYLIKFHIGNVYTIDPIPAKPEMNTPNATGERHETRSQDE